MWPPSSVAGEAGCDLEVALGDLKWELDGPGAKVGDPGEGTEHHLDRWSAGWLPARSGGRGGPPANRSLLCKHMVDKSPSTLPASSGCRVSAGGLEFSQRAVGRLLPEHKALGGFGLSPHGIRELGTGLRGMRSLEGPPCCPHNGLWG